MLDKPAGREDTQPYIWPPGWKAALQQDCLLGSFLFHLRWIFQDPLVPNMAFPVYPQQFHSAILILVLLDQLLPRLWYVRHKELEGHALVLGFCIIMITFSTFLCHTLLPSTQLKHLLIPDFINSDPFKRNLRSVPPLWRYQPKSSHPSFRDQLKSQSLREDFWKLTAVRIPLLKGSNNSMFHKWPVDGGGWEKSENEELVMIISISLVNTLIKMFKSHCTIIKSWI